MTNLRAALFVTASELAYQADRLSTPDTPARDEQEEHYRARLQLGYQRAADLLVSMTDVRLVAGEPATRDMNEVLAALEQTAAALERANKYVRILRRYVEGRKERTSRNAPGMEAQREAISATGVAQPFTEEG